MGSLFFAKQMLPTPPPLPSPRGVSFQFLSRVPTGVDIFSIIY